MKNYNPKYDPPDDEYFKKAYDEGFHAAEAGKSLDDNPYEPSGHPRDTTFTDELNYYWYSGHSDFTD